MTFWQPSPVQCVVWKVSSTNSDLVISSPLNVWTLVLNIFALHAQLWMAYPMLWLMLFRVDMSHTGPSEICLCVKCENTREDGTHQGVLSVQVERVDYKSRIIPLLHMSAYVVLQVTHLSFSLFEDNNSHWHFIFCLGERQGHGAFLCIMFQTKCSCLSVLAKLGTFLFLAVVCNSSLLVCLNIWTIM